MGAPAGGAAGSLGSFSRSNATREAPKWNEAGPPRSSPFRSGDHPLGRPSQQREVHRGGAGLPADEVLLDLENAVAPVAKHN